jgi:hypothetical protein
MIMAVYSGPNAVRDGLVLNLDAGDPKSFIPGSTMWRDTSGLRNNATMFGTVPSEIDVTQCFNFATATGISNSASMGFTFASNMVQTTGDFTLSCWIKNPNTTSGQVGLFSNAGGADGYRFGAGTNGIYYLMGPNYQEGNVGFSSGNLQTTLWYHIVAVYARTSAKILLYKNGIYEAQASLPASQTAYSSGAPGMVRSPCCGLYTGKIAAFSVHNKSLTNDEILQNFDSAKGRFGY